MLLGGVSDSKLLIDSCICAFALAVIPSQEPYTDWISFGSSAADVQSAVLASGLVTHVDVTVSATTADGSPYAWDLTFNQYDATTQTMTGQSGNLVTMSMKANRLVGFNAAPTVTPVQDGGDVISGQFTISWNSITLMLPHDASTTDVEAAVIGLGIASGATVNRAGPSTVGTYDWTVVLLNAYSLGGAGTTFTVSNAALTGTAPTVTSTLVSPVVPPLAGNFNLAIGSSAPVPVPYSADAATMQAAVNSIAQDVTVTAGVANTITGGQTWQLTFAGLRYANGASAITLDATPLLGNSITLGQSPLKPVLSAGVALLTFSPTTTGHFTLTAGGMNTAPITIATSTAALSAAISALPGLGTVYVEQTLGSLSGFLEWRILFATALTSSGALGLDTSSMSASEASSTTLITEHTATVIAPAIGGTVSLIYSQVCSERVSGTWCTPGVTAPITVNPIASATTIETALEALPGVYAVTAQTSIVSGTPARTGYGIASTEVQLSVTFDSVQLNTAGSQTAAHWVTTWSPDNEATLWNTRRALSGTPQLGTNVITGGPLPYLSVDTSLMLGTEPDYTVEKTVPGLQPESGATVPVEVTLNGQDWTSDGTPYAYVPLAEVLSLTPPRGPLQGGTEVLIAGANFQQSALLACRFGGIPVPVSAWLDSQRIICVAPAQTLAGPVAVEVSNTGVPHWATSSATDLPVGYNASIDDSWSKSGVMYTYNAPVEIISVVPHLGPTSGNFSVIITGGPFPLDSTGLIAGDLRCKFGTAAVLAVALSGTQIQCYAPPQLPGQYVLEVSLNDQDYTELRFPFLYYSDPGMSRITPVSGPAVAAGTQVRLINRR